MKYTKRVTTKYFETNRNKNEKAKQEMHVRLY